MKKVYLILLIFVFFFALLFFLKKDYCEDNKAKIYQINSKNYCLLTANSQEQWEKGLMFYKKPINFDGIIFVFPDKQMRSFWNKNTYLDLDLYWMDDEKIIGKSFLPSTLKTKKIITVSSPGKVNQVVEIIF